MLAHEKFQWTDDLVAQAFHLRDVDGLSAAEIGRKLGCTRNAVCGKFMRVEVARGIRTVQPRPPRKRRRPPTKTPPLTVAPIVAPLAKLPPPPKPVPRPAPKVISTGQVCTITEITTGCKWPVGHVEGIPDRHLFCNAPRWRDDGPPYCEGHAAKMVRLK